ncbi:MAG: 4-hydroxyphenylacetate 3-hydroxylase N-terminal domain-containing protein [Actinomycetota bacterium]|jgi:4-hydroxyphenylacetate 3-monooxygenase
MGARSGKQYLVRLQQHSPEFWFGGERVEDCTTHPATASAASEIARLYDLSRDEDHQEYALFPSPLTGDLVSTQFLVPTSREDLVRRRQMHKLWADATYGLMGRTTDFVGSMLTAWYINAQFFGPYADNVRRYFEEVRERDLFLTHALIDPPVDRSKPASEQPDPFTYLGVVQETAEGLVVRGAKMFATAAPYADEILVWPFSLKQPTEKERPYAIAFAVPTDTPGLRFIGREPYGQGNPFDRPLASRFDEMDAVAVFDDVLVPWERVFINQDHDQVKNIWRVNSNAFTGHQTSIRLLSKLQFVAGVARRATEMVKTDEFPHVRDMLGEIVSYIELTRAAIIAAEATAQPNEDGVMFPNVTPLYAVRNSGNRWYPRVREIVQQILAGGLLYQPASVTAFSSPIGDDVRQFFRGPQTSAEERIKLFNVACDLAVHSFGSRHELYERLYAGDPTFLRIMTQFVQYDWREPLQLVDRLLSTYSAGQVLAGLESEPLGEVLVGGGDG